MSVDRLAAIASRVALHRDGAYLTMTMPTDDVADLVAALHRVRERHQGEALTGPTWVPGTVECTAEHEVMGSGPHHPCEDYLATMLPGETPP